MAVSGREFETAWRRCQKLVGKIECCRATTLEGLQVKALAVLRCHSGETELDFADANSTTDLRLARSIVLDLLP